MSLLDREWVGIAETKRYKKILEFELVLTAVGIESRVEKVEHVWILFVPTDLARGGTRTNLTISDRKSDLQSYSYAVANPG